MSIYKKPKGAEKKKRPAKKRNIYKKPKGASDTPVEEGDAVDTALDTAYGAAQGATFNAADEIYGGVKAALETGGGSRREFGEAYGEHRDEAREQWAKARERSPIATTVGEVGGAIVSPASKVFGATKGLRGIMRGAGEGAAHSYGATDKEDLKDQLIESGKGAALGAGVGALSNLATKGWSKSPNATRAEVLGVKGKDYLVDGPGDRKKIIERINESGMLKNRKMEYDPDKMKFVPRSKSKMQLDELEMNTEERFLSRAEDAVEKLQRRKEEYYGPLLDNRFIPTSDVDKMAQEIADEYSKRGLLKGPMARTKDAVKKVKDNIHDQIMVNLGGDTTKVSLRDLDTLKKMAQEDVRNFSKGLGELGDNDELARITARKLKNLVEDNIGNEGFKKINSAQHDFLSVSGDLKNKIKSLDLEAPNRQQLERSNMVEGVLDNLSGGSQGRLDSAARKEWWESHIPKPVRAIAPYAAEETPGALFRQNMQGQDNSRSPDSVPNIPEQLIRTPLPRSTQALMEKKPFVLAKVAQMMPEQYEAVKDAYEHDPESLPELAQVISMKMPHVFEKDKYNRFDGRIIDEKSKALAIKDTLLKDELNAIEQAKIITKLNKTGEFDL